MSCMLYIGNLKSNLDFIHSLIHSFIHSFIPGYPFKESFKTDSQSYYSAELQELDFVHAAEQVHVHNMKNIIIRILSVNNNLIII